MIRSALIAASLSCAAAPPPPGALSCTGCHVPGGAMGALQGRPAEAIAADMAAFRSGVRPATLMDRIARGFTPEQTRLIASWFAQQ